MGTWDSGIFDSDDAYEWDEELQDDAVAFFTRSFQLALARPGRSRLDTTAGHAVLVSAAYLDQLFNGTHHRTDNDDSSDERNVNCFGTLHPELRTDPATQALLPFAVAALHKVLSERSDLNAEWQGAPLHSAWRANVQALQARLQQHLP